MTKIISSLNNTWLCPQKGGFPLPWQINKRQVLKVDHPNLDPINPLVLLSMNRQCRQDEAAEGEEKGFQEEVHGFTHSRSIRAIDELRGALRRQAKPSCKEISRYPCRLGSIGNPWWREDSPPSGARPIPEHPAHAPKSPPRIPMYRKAALWVGRKRGTSTVLWIGILLLLYHCCNSMKLVW